MLRQMAMPYFSLSFDVLAPVDSGAGSRGIIFGRFQEFQEWSQCTAGVNSGASMSYTYDADSRLASVTDAVGTTNYSYDAVGNLNGMTYPNGVSASYSYNPLNRLTNMQSICGTHNGCGTPGSPIASYSYTLGAAGNRLSVVELSGRTVSYGYDDLYRLATETIAGASAENGIITYQYDSVGNRKHLSSTVPAIPSVSSCT